jgi:predicted enzyme related to lactoylglutathione lyase
MIIEGLDTVSIVVKDAKASAKFYSELFDFEIEDDSNPKAIILNIEPIKVKLVQIEKSESALSASSLPVLSFVMDEDDFTDAISEIEDKKIKIVKGPESIPKGESLTFADLDNNLIEIFYLS